MTLTPDEREAAIEKMARAIYEADKQSWDPEWDRVHSGIHDLARKVATAALDAVLPLIERAVRADMRSRLAKAHEKLGGVQAPAMNGDNLAVSLCSYFDEGDDWPEGDGPDDCGWSPSAINGYEQTIDAIRQHYTRALADEVRT